eukprot:TRINITY_DN2685_c0_g2_i1.p1 TRINITY_DN2685_c0_g2~~TRINITY_DN2685_c0_g2_i1.p1  ORF type:complete len:208 (-),score=19.44 TRINITY_DN2685_c0_g2_i1:513-1136(-)
MSALKLCSHWACSRRQFPRTYFASLSSPSDVQNSENLIDHRPLRNRWQARCFRKNVLQLPTPFPLSLGIEVSLLALQTEKTYALERTSRLRLRTRAESAEAADTPSSIMPCHGCRFEVFGKVQGVCFRQYTLEKALTLGLVGWVRNSRQGSVQGQIQGGERAVQEMKRWLATTGSPASRIEKCLFADEVDDLEQPTFLKFEIKKSEY